MEVGTVAGEISAEVISAAFNRRMPERKEVKK